VPPRIDRLEAFLDYERWGTMNVVRWTLILAGSIGATFVLFNWIDVYQRETLEEANERCREMTATRHPDGPPFETQLAAWSRCMDNAGFYLERMKMTHGR